MRLWMSCGLLAGVLVSVPGCGRKGEDGDFKSVDNQQNGQQTGTHGDHGGNARNSANTNTLAEARKGFTTQIVRDDESAGPPDLPPPATFQRIKYPSPAGPLWCYLTPDPSDGQKHPAIVWITGGDCNTIGDVWSPQSRANDQSARAFREAGIVMMFPSLRGGNDNPGRREGFYGEVDDILAAAEDLAKRPYVDPERIYLGGHSTGGTMVMLVAEMSGRFAGVISLGPVAEADQYGGQFLYCNPRDAQEVKLRSPAHWLDSVRKPLFVLEGANQGNWAAIAPMQQANTNPQVQFFRVPGHDHFSVIAPVAELLAQRIVANDFRFTQADLARLR